MTIHSANGSLPIVVYLSYTNFSLSAMRASLLRTLAPALTLLSATANAQLSTRLDSTTLAAFRWRSLGPANMSGRVSDIEVDPNDSRIYYVATAAGGVWKTINNGTTFFPLFDKQDVISLGDLAIAPSEPNTLYLGTGEQNTRNSISPGGGIFKSTDGGRTWTFKGLKETQQIGRVVVHPTNPNIVYVAALGRAWGFNPERGVYKSTNGGDSWDKVLFVSDRAGAVDIVMDPSDPNTLYASTWERVRTPYSLKSGGPGSALWKTTDAGAHWTKVSGPGWPTTTLGRIGLTISLSNPKVLYANVEADTNPNPKRPDKADTTRAQKINSGIYRTADGGTTWTQTYRNSYSLEQRPFYYSQVRVDPKDENRIYWMSSVFRFSTDGGKSYRRGALSIHTDWHAMWIDPKDPNHFLIGDDGGIAVTWDRGGTYDFINTFPIGQFYQVSFDFQKPYRVCGGLQDNGSWCGPSRTTTAQGARNDDWFNVGGGDGFYTAQDPNDPNYIYAESQGGNISRLNLATGYQRSIRRSNARQRDRQFEDSLVVARGDTTTPETPDVSRRLADIRRRQSADSSLDLRFNWETPFFLSPHQSTTIYAAGNKVIKSINRGDSWTAISPDLSTVDSARIIASMRATGGVTADNTGAETYGTITALMESTIRPGLLWAGTDDGNLWVSRNDGGSWELIHGTSPTAGRKNVLAGAPAKGWIRRVVPSQFDSATVYVVMDDHQNNDFEPYLWVSNDFGRTFRSLVNDLPKGGIDYLHVLAEDPRNRNLLFVGSDRGAYVSTDRGAHWQKFITNLPTVPVRDLKIHPRDRELIAATHGRSIWSVDIAPLEDMSDSAMVASAQLFTMKPAFQWAVRFEQMWNGNKIFQADNPPYGAQIAYRVAGTPTSSTAAEDNGRGSSAPNAGGGSSRAAAPDSARIVITNAAGDTVRSLRGPGGAGLHRVYWDLRGRPGPLSPSGLRDSAQAAQRQRARDDSTRAANSARDTVNARGQNPGTDTTSARGARATGGGGARRPGGGGDQINLRPAEEQIGAGGGGGRGGRGGGGRTGGYVEPGDYIVTVTVGGRTMKQVVRVERVGEVGNDDPFGGDDDGDEERH